MLCCLIYIHSSFENMDSYINKTVQAPQNHPPFSPASHPTNPPLRQPILQYPSKPHPFTLFLRPTTTQHATNPSHLARLQSSASAHNTPAIQPQYKQHTPCPSSIIPIPPTHPYSRIPPFFYLLFVFHMKNRNAPQLPSTLPFRLLLYISLTWQDRYIQPQ